MPADLPLRMRLRLPGPWRARPPTLRGMRLRRVHVEFAHLLVGSTVRRRSCAQTEARRFALRRSQRVLRPCGGSLERWQVRQERAVLQVIGVEYLAEPRT